MTMRQKDDNQLAARALALLGQRARQGTLRMYREMIEAARYSAALLDVAALTQEAMAAECEALRAPEPAVMARAAAAAEKAGAEMASILILLHPARTWREEHGVWCDGVWGGSAAFGRKHLARLTRCMDGFPARLVSLIPAWGGVVIERHRKRAFPVPGEGGAPAPLPRDPETLRELAAVHRWQKQVFEAAAAARRAEALAMHEKAAAYEGGEEALNPEALAVQMRASSAVAEVIEGLARCEVAGHAARARAARVLKREFPARLVDELPRLGFVKMAATLAIRRAVKSGDVSSLARI